MDGDPRRLVAFIDFEASSLRFGSHPLEVGWAVDGGPLDSVLIRPAEGWDDWDPRSERVHGISREELRSDGAPAAQVVACMLAAFGDDGGVVLASDAPGWDQRWLDALLDAAGVQVRLHVQAAEPLYLEAARSLLQLAPPEDGDGAFRRAQVLRSLEAEAAELVLDVHAAELARGRVRHRAGCDAGGMLWVLQEVRRRVEDRLAAAGRRVR